MPRPSSDAPSVSCGRCRRRKIRCNRQKPCSQCTKAGEDCVFPGGGERQRPAPRRYVQALETRVASLESLIQNLSSADDVARARLLAGLRSQPGSLPSAGLPLLADAAAAAALADVEKSGRETDRDCINVAIESHSQAEATNTLAATPSASPSASATTTGDLAVARAREGRLRKLAGRRATQFFGGTSLFQLQLSETAADPAASAGSPLANGSPMWPHAGTATAVTPSTIPTTTPGTAPAGSFPYEPHGETCRQLVAFFFQNVYQYYFCVYREYFLRDYVAGGGPYYSDMLLFCICAVGALVSTEPERQALAAVFVERAESLLLSSLHQPELATLQSLLVLAQIEIGQGRGSKGWLFCGMACRLTHEMGLHLDPNNWSGSNNSNDNGGGRPVESSADREILRRVYWAAFIVDKQLSLYFGRPPALYPHEADVRNTIRIPYPPEWETLLDTYISPGTSATAFEDGLATVGTFTHQAELAKVLHDMIVDVFENRNHLRGGSDDVDSAVAAAAAAEAAQRIHERLVRWLVMLPQKLHWNQWTVGRVAPYVLHLHLLFHTSMIILHRPPRRHLDDAAVAHGEDVEVCYESLAAILRLLRSYTRHHRLALLPLDIVHTLSAAAGVVLMRRHIEHLAWADSDVSKPLGLLLDAMRAVQHVYPCITEILDGIVDAVNAGHAQDRARAARSDRSTSSEHGYSPDVDLGVMHILENGRVGVLPNAWHAAPATAGPEEPIDNLGFLVTDDFLNGVGVYDWDGH